MSFESDLRKVRKRAEEQGWRVEKRGEYWWFWPPARELPPVPIAGTGHTKGRAWNNFLATMRRRGYRP
jgi:hypothetical protein